MGLEIIDAEKFAASKGEIWPEKDGRTRLLMVDDQSDSHTSFIFSVKSLLRDRDFTLHTYYEPADLLRAINHADPARTIVVTDNDMQDVYSGVDVANKIKEVHPDLPVAIWSGHAHDIITGPKKPPANVPVFDKGKLNEMLLTFVAENLDKVGEAKRPPAPAAKAKAPTSDAA